MKCKKYNYLLLLILMLMIGINEVNAEVCYYINEDKSTTVEYNSSTQKFKMEKIQGETKDFELGIANNKTISSKFDTYTGINVSQISSGCPEYVVYRFLSGNTIWGFRDQTSANNFEAKSNGISSTTYVTMLRYKKSSGEKYTSTEYQEAVEQITCEGLFGDPDKEDSLRHLIDEILRYPQIIVPILVILLGTIDFAKAVIAANEDGMRKAQKDFIRRVLIGVAVFLVPVLVDILMSLADIVWNGVYTSCGL